MTDQVRAQLECLITRYPVLKAVETQVAESFEILRQCYENGGKLMIGGNGGSCADSEHIVGELMKGFKKPRKMSRNFGEALRAADPVMGAELAEALQGGLPSVALSAHPALNTAFLNDVNGEMMYAQQVNALGKAGDVFLGISTSGNSKNIRYAAVTARAKGMKVIGLTGKKRRRPGPPDGCGYHSTLQ